MPEYSNRLSENTSASGGAGICREAWVEMRTARQKVINRLLDIDLKPSLPVPRAVQRAFLAGYRRQLEIRFHDTQGGFVEDTEMWIIRSAIEGNSSHHM